MWACTGGMEWYSEMRSADWIQARLHQWWWRPRPARRPSDRHFETVGRHHASKGILFPGWQFKSIVNNSKKHMALGIFSEQTILVLQGLNLILSLVIIACNRLLQALQRLLSQLWQIIVQFVKVCWALAGAFFDELDSGQIGTFLLKSTGGFEQVELSPCK